MTERTPEHQYQIIFEGRVQDVGFRDVAESYATRHKLRGHIRNLASGYQVKAVVQATRPSADAFALYLKRKFRCSSKTTRQKKGRHFLDFKVID